MKLIKTAPASQLPTRTPDSTQTPIPPGQRLCFPFSLYRSASFLTHVTGEAAENLGNTIWARGEDGAAPRLQHLWGDVRLLDFCSSDVLPPHFDLFFFADSRLPLVMFGL